MDFPTLDDSSRPPSIHFQTEDIEFDFENHLSLWEAWIRQVIQAANCRLSQLSYTFCSDAYLHQVNLSYLQHDTFTDIITFPYQEPPIVEGDIMISLDRVRENAQTLDEPFDRELARVIIHGVLHLCGQKDKTISEAQEMRQKENAALELLRKF